jgi:acetylornithine deacetylase/succinyl-diaminopimelate desuccinylase-like protein
MAQDESDVVDICRDLIRIDTSNPDKPERPAAEYVAAKLSDAGLEPRLLESERGRTSVIARWPGEDRSRAGLLIHGHLDVVPAAASDWSVDPFAGEIKDGCLWGRGAVDMKNMDAMVLALLGRWTAAGKRPPRDVVLAFCADEEMGGGLGSNFLANEHPEEFEGCSEAISEVGGFSVTVADDVRVYLVETAQKGMAWLRLVASGKAGHGSFVHDDNAVTLLAEAVAAIGNHQFPLTMTPTVRELLQGLAETLDLPYDENDPADLVARLGSVARIVGATLHNTANPTMLTAGYKHNVIPSTAEARIDGRFLPGYEDEMLAEIDKLLPAGVRREMVHRDIGLETSWDGALVDAMVGSIIAEDPAARVLPYMLSGGTDAKAFSRLGMRCFGFSPLKLPPGTDFAGMFHGIDERVPLDALQFGVRVLDRFLSAS